MNRNLEADINHQENEDEEGEAVWLREQGHCKTTSVGGRRGVICPKAPPLAAEATGKRGDQGEPLECVSQWEKGLAWITGQIIGGCRSRQP